MELTAEQARLAEENHNLIYSYMKIRNLNIEDWYDVCAIAFCRSIVTYDGSQGSRLSTYTYQAMDFAVMRVRRDAKRRAINTASISLDDPIGPDEMGSLTYLDAMGEDDKSLLSLENWEMVDYCLSKLTPIERQAVCLYGAGRTMQGVAGIMGYSQAHISRILSKAHRKIRAIRSR